jgi:hypothetical protein
MAFRVPRIVKRLLYWCPVLVCMVLFAQVSFLGLRPALSERRRLSEAEAMLEARHARDLELRDQATLGLRVRGDPIFLERQRRLRLHGGIPSSSRSGE